MKAIDYHTNTKKAEWKDGPWKNEPDKMQYTDKATGYPCLIVRHGESGHLCGYVGVTEGHPAFGKGYDDVRVDGEWPEVHGGLTFSDFCQETKEECTGICHTVEAGENDRVWWFGFDCAHHQDYCPGHEALLSSIPGCGGRKSTDSYKTVVYVRDENTKLAKQLKEIAQKGRMN